MTEETKPEPIPEHHSETESLKNQVALLTTQLENVQFFSDPVRFNLTLFQGFKLMLDKLTSLDQKLSKVEEKLHGDKV